MRKVRQRQKLHRRRNGKRVWILAKARFTSPIVRVFAPVDVNLTESQKRAATLAFCRKIRKVYLQEQRSVILDFSHTRKISSLGMLVVVAEVDRAQRLGKSNQRFLCKLPEQNCEETKIVRQVLDQIEILDRTGHPPLTEDRAGYDKSVVNWRYATGTRVDEEPGDVLERHEGRVAPALMEKMQIGLMEAITNSLHHAYRGDRDDGCGVYRERRWWMFTHEADGLLQVLVCDLGIGIARSLPLKWDRHFLKKLASLFQDDHRDVSAIKMALILGQSSTDEENRGKGMHQIWNAVHETDVGGVAILTGSGHLSYSAETKSQKSGSYDSKFLGTLVSWQVSIQDAASASDG